MNRGAAYLVLALAGVAGWWGVLGPDLLYALPMALCGALVVARRLRPLAGVAALALWVPIAPLLAGIPLHALRPRAWNDTVASLTDGLNTIGSAGGGGLFDEPGGPGAGVVGPR